MSESKTPTYKNNYGIAVRGYESRLGGIYKSEDVALSVGKDTDAVHALVRFSDVVHAFDDMQAALSLVARIREALGDNGKRMQPELIEYCRQLVADRAELVEALRELVRVDDIPGMAVREWDAAIDNVRALLARIEGGR
jgi:hypothetical protein